MPSDFISLLSADLDLDCPKSLYSKACMPVMGCEVKTLWAVEVLPLHSNWECSKCWDSIKGSRAAQSGLASKEEEPPTRALELQQPAVQTVGTQVPGDCCYTDPAEPQGVAAAREPGDPAAMWDDTSASPGEAHFLTGESSFQSDSFLTIRDCLKLLDEDCGQKLCFPGTPEQSTAKLKAVCAVGGASFGAYH